MATVVPRQARSGEITGWPSCCNSRHCQSIKCQRWILSRIGVLLLRRLRLPLPFNVCTYRCGRPLDAFWHRAACSTVGGAWQKRICSGKCHRADLQRGRAGFHERDASRLRHHTFPQKRRTPLGKKGLTLFGGSQLAVDATVVSPLHADGTHRRQADTTDGAGIGGGT